MCWATPVKPHIMCKSGTCTYLCSSRKYSPLCNPGMSATLAPTPNSYVVQAQLKFMFYESTCLCKSVAYVRACATSPQIHMFGATLTRIRIRATLARIHICATPAHIHLAQLQALVQLQNTCIFVQLRHIFFFNSGPHSHICANWAHTYFGYSSSAYGMLCIFAQLRLLFRGAQPWHIFFTIYINRTDT